MQPLFEHRLELAGFETRALELEGSGPPLILLHGFADSADTWRTLLDRLGRGDRRAVAFDLPGFGTADPLRPDEPVLAQLTAFAKAAVQHHAPKGGAIVCGNSLGGCLSLLLAERRGLRLAGIVPVAPAGLDMARWLTLIEREPVLRALLASPLPVPPQVLQRVVLEIYKRLVFHHPEAIEPLIGRAFTSHFRDRRTTAQILGAARRMLPELRDPFELGRIGCPVRLVWGDHDAMVFKSGAERVLESVPDAELTLIEDCGHCPQIEAADRLAELLLDFPGSLAHAA
ncbi:MAG TPA: alpha/beta fold hydrolase [Thermoleophilaceae bacterium]|nr:alpha/beta fold hydrolase [Thermoleophilaceae bacterium]